MEFEKTLLAWSRSRTNLVSDWSKFRQVNSCVKTLTGVTEMEQLVMIRNNDLLFFLSDLLFPSLKNNNLFKRMEGCINTIHVQCYQSVDFPCGLWYSAAELH